MGIAVVHSHFPAPVQLRLYEMSDDDGQVGFSVNVTGVPTARRSGEPVVVRPGRNEIDVDFWKKWAAQNKDTHLGRHITVEVVEDQPKGA